MLDYVGPHDDQWAIINYNGGQAYVASQYISVSEIPDGLQSGKENETSQPESGASESAEGEIPSAP